LLAGIVMGLLMPVLLYKLSVRYNFTWLFTLEKPETKDTSENKKLLSDEDQKPKQQVPH